MTTLQLAKLLTRALDSALNLVQSESEAQGHLKRLIGRDFAYLNSVLEVAKKELKMEKDILDPFLF